MLVTNYKTAHEIIFRCLLDFVTFFNADIVSEIGFSIGMVLHTQIHLIYRFKA